MPFSTPKPAWASRTLWVNGLTIAAAVLTALSGVSHAIPAEYMPYIVTGLAAVNFALRFVTNAPVSTS